MSPMSVDLLRMGWGTIATICIRFTNRQLNCIIDGITKKMIDCIVLTQLETKLLSSAVCTMALMR
jgi:hypothetical protein